MRGIPHTVIDTETNKFIKIEDLDTVCDNLKAIYDEQQYTNDRLKERLKEITDEKWKDKQLQELKEQAEKYRHEAMIGFTMTDEDVAKVKEWKEQHMVKQHNLTTLEQRLRWGGAVGGNFVYEFCPTSIGTVGTCICGNCRAKAFAEANGDYRLFQSLLKTHDAEFEFQELS